MARLEAESDLRPGLPFKKCKLCSIEKTRSEFSGRNAACRVCINVRDREKIMAKRRARGVKPLDPFDTDGFRVCISCNVRKHRDECKKNYRVCLSCFNKKQSEKAIQKRRADGIGPDGWAGRRTFDATGSRSCTKCEIDKPEEEFPLRVKGKRWRNPVCKTCTSEISRAYETKNRTRRTMQRHGLTIAEYNEIICSQGGKCAICHSEETAELNGRFCVDHDHKTGKIRGVLCANCNWGIGQFKDNTVLLASAISYLTRAGAV